MGWGGRGTTGHFKTVNRCEVCLGKRLQRCDGRRDKAGGRTGLPPALTLRCTRTAGGRGGSAVLFLLPNPRSFWRGGFSPKFDSGIWCSLGSLFAPVPLDGRGGGRLGRGHTKSCRAGDRQLPTSGPKYPTRRREAAPGAAVPPRDVSVLAGLLPPGPIVPQTRWQPGQPPPTLPFSSIPPVPHPTSQLLLRTSAVRSPKLPLPGPINEKPTALRTYRPVTLQLYRPTDL